MAETDVTGMVTTMDGDSVAVVDALTLNWGRVLKAKLATRQPALRGALQGLLEGLKRDPRTYAVARPDSPKATQLAAVIETITVEGDVPLWVPLTSTLEAWEKRQADYATQRETRVQTAEEADARVRVEAEAYARRVAEKRRAEAEKAEAAAAALGGFIPAEVQAERAERRDERREARGEVSALEDLIRPFVDGQGRVDDNKRPSTIMVNGQAVRLASFWGLKDQLTDGVDAAHVSIACAFCHEQGVLGETIPWRKRQPDGTSVDTRVLKMRQILLVVRTADGRDVYSNTFGDRKGEPRRLNVAVCRRCAGIATRLSPPQADSKNPGKTMPSVLPTDIYTKFVTWLEGQTAKDGMRTAASVGPNGNVRIVDAPIKPARNAPATRRTSAGPSGPISDATATGQSANPTTRDEGFVDAAEALERAADQQPTLTHSPFADLGARK